MPVGFDEYAKNYDAALDLGLSATGEGKDYFARNRILWLEECLRKLGMDSGRIMDYGCGTGSATNFFFELLRPVDVLGVDTSEGSLELARHSFAAVRARFVLNTDYKPDGEVDLVFCNGVFHHIPPNERDRELTYIKRSLRPGGLFSFWENNPWNPGTRYVMSRIPFDRDAITLAPTEARRLLRKNGFEILRTDFLFFFPNILESLRWLEPALTRVPLGGQYQILCKKAEESSAIPSDKI